MEGSTEIHGSPRNSNEFHGIPQISGGPHGPPRKFRIFPRVPGVDVRQILSVLEVDRRMEGLKEIYMCTLHHRLESLEELRGSS